MRTEEIRRPRIFLNGMPLTKQNNDLVLQSHDCNRIIEKIKNSSGSSAHYLAGPYTTGKTNTLYQIQVTMEVMGYTAVFIDGDVRLTEEKWSIMVEGLRKIDFVEEYISKLPVTKDTLALLTHCCDAFNKMKNDNLEKYSQEKVVICIDESQNYEVLNSNLWTQVIRELVRKRHDVWIICGTSSFQFFLPLKEILLDSPFDQFYFLTSFFSKDQIKEALLLLQGNGNYFIDISMWVDEMTNDIFAETNGHPYLCAHYFLVLRDILNEVNSSTYGGTSNQIPTKWKYATFYVNRKITESRLKSKIMSESSHLKNYVEASGILYDKVIPFEKKEQWQLNLLRLGIVKLNEDNSLVLNCNIMRILYLYSIAPPIPPQLHISHLCSTEGSVDILILVKHLFSQLPFTPFLKKESWVGDKIKNSEKGPSEKLYQTHFFSILSAMCNGSSLWYPLYEMNRTDGKVDLGLINGKKKEKYLIELGVNCADTGDGSCQFHYERQYSKYHDKDVAGSIVVMIYTNNNEHPLYYPKNNYPSIKYIVVEHYVLYSPKIIKVRERKNQKPDIIALVS